MKDATHEPPGEGTIAIIGWACRFPGAEDPDSYWRLLREGRTSITQFSDEEMLAAGVPPAVLKHPQYVKAGAILEGVDQFDASFFDINPKDAAIMDPQQRLFLECVWEALERAGYPPSSHDGVTGLFAGCGMNHYFLRYLLPNPGLVQNTDELQLSIANDRDFFATRIAYLLNLKGPAVNVQTACSTSLVAVHLACQSLLSGESDLALAGGVSIRVPQKTGYLYREGRISSSDGQCRPFDARADGCIGGNGSGVVVLKTWEDAYRDGDTILALIRGTAINNDGSQKVSFTAPSIEGQAEVISVALAAADVDPATISYVEAHGTGTTLGDPIEIKALTQAFGNHRSERRCGVGSVKSNMGHLNAAAGIAGLMKVALALEQKALPPSLNFDEPNPMIDFENTPFYVQDRGIDWPSHNRPRRACVSSFGMGGTNAHAVLEEALPRQVTVPPPPPYLLVLSAQTEAALATTATRLHDYFEGPHPAPIHHIAFTLQNGRTAFNHRAFLLCEDASNASERLARPETLVRAVTEAGHRSTVFLFPGQGTQYPGMGADLYAAEPVFKEHLDRCFYFLKRRMDLDLRPLFFPEPNDAASAKELLGKSEWCQPALFSVEYALAQLWRSLGVEPEAMMGHSLGEITAAACAGVFTLEAALELVVLRGRFMDQQPPGAMLSVLLGEEKIKPYLGEKLSLAAINAPRQCTVSGTPAAIAELETQLTSQRVAHVRLPGGLAFHSPIMKTAAASLREKLEDFSLASPTIPFISNLSGDWIKPEEAMDPAYWARQLLGTVQCSAGLSRILTEKGRVFLEIGPGKVLTGLTQKHLESGRAVSMVVTLPNAIGGPKEPPFAAALGQAWLAGLSLRWRAWRPDFDGCRVPLPTYPFERRRYWVDPPSSKEPQRGAGDRAEEMRVSLGNATTHRKTTVPYEPPSTALEQELAQICERVLGAIPVGIHDPFFEIGGDSLLATQVTAHIHDSLEPTLPPKAIFEHPTVAQLAELIQTLRWADNRQKTTVGESHTREQGTL